jgi:homoserine dehydrogenase
MSRPPIRLCLAGAGNVGRSLLEMLRERGPELRRRYGADVTVVAVAELGGAAVDPDGLDVDLLLMTLSAGQPLSGLPGVGRPGLTPEEALAAAGPEFLLEATPVNLTDGEPGLGTVRAALAAGVHVVLANKAPLALAYAELVAASDPDDGWSGEPARSPTDARRRPRLRFSATVAGALPVVNLGWRDLAGSAIQRIEGVFNGTSHGILRAMEGGHEFAEALADAQRRGIAEADPSLDIDGHDAACKLVIAANAALGRSYTLADVTVAGIRDVTGPAVRTIREQGGCLVLLSQAEREGLDHFRLTVGPATVPADHPLARLGADEMGVVFYADGVDRLSAASLEPGPQPAAAAMLRDVIDILRSRTCP